MGNSESRGRDQVGVNWLQPLSVLLVDFYEEELLFIVTSETYFMVSYEVYINRAGQVKCECKDSGFRKKAPNFLDLLTNKNKHSCKHQRAVIKEIIRRTEIK